MQMITRMPHEKIECQCVLEGKNTSIKAEKKPVTWTSATSYNPFEANITTDGADGDDQTKEKLDTNVGVPLNDPPAEMNVQSPSEDESPHDDSLV